MCVWGFFSPPRAPKHKNKKKRWLLSDLFRSSASRWILSYLMLFTGPHKNHISVPLFYTVDTNNNSSLPAGHYTLIMCPFSPAKITPLSLWVDPEPAVKVFGCYCWRELGEWKGFVFFSPLPLDVGAANAWRTAAEWMLFTAERAAVLMMSAIKQQRCRRRSGSSLLPPATRQLRHANGAPSLCMFLSQ